MYHSSIYIHKQIPNLLRKAGIALEDFNLAVIKGKPAKRKNDIDVKNKQVTIFCSDCVVKGFVK